MPRQYVNRHNQIKILHSIDKLSVPCLSHHIEKLEAGRYHANLETTR